MFTKNMLSVETANMQLLEFALLKEKEKVTVIKINAKETVTRLDILTLMFILDQIIYVQPICSFIVTVLGQLFCLRCVSQADIGPNCK